MTSTARVACSLAVALAFGSAAAAEGTDAYDTALRFRRDGREVKVIERDALAAACAVRTITLDDPYYGRRKSFRACPLAKVVELGFGDVAGSDDVFLRARDGYVRTTTRTRLREDGGWLALADAERAHDGDPGWEPIDRRQVDPGPYYIVWTGAAQRDVHRYPWPYQLASIELTSFAREYPHTVPAGIAEGAPPWQGYAVFRDQCISCHAVNGEGGTVGPELNVPRSIVEYRHAEQLKQFIRDPGSFRYTSMPAHTHLTAEELDGLIAYFTAMRDRKHDPHVATRPRDEAAANAPASLEKSGSGPTEPGS